MRTKLFFVSFIVAAGSGFHFGFQLVVTDPSEDVFIAFEKASIKKHYSKELKKSILDDIWSVTVALFFVGAICGSFLINLLAEKLGRKKALILNYIICFISLLLASLSYFIDSFELYAFSRITLGFSNAVSLSIGALYLSEISPLHLRGRIGMSTGMSVQFGLVAGSFIATPQMLGTEHQWWIIYLGEACLLMISLLIITLFPESPEFLSNSSQDLQAKNAILYFHQCSEVEAEKVLEELKLQNENKEKMGLLEIWKFSETRKRTVLSIAVMFGTTFSGVAAINAFAVDILDSAGLSVTTASNVNVGLSIVSFLAACASSFVVDQFGRRPLLLMSFTAILACNIFIGVLLFLHDRNSSSDLVTILLIFFFAIFLTFFALGCGPLSFFIPTELNDLNSRSASQAWTSFTQMTTRAILLAGFLPLKTAMGSSCAYLLLFVIPVISVIIYLYFCLPETKNRTQKQLSEDIRRPNLFFSTLCCSSSSTSL